MVSQCTKYLWFDSVTLQRLSSALEVGRPTQSRTRDKLDTKFGTPDPYPAFEVDLQVVPVTRRVRSVTA